MAWYIHLYEGGPSSVHLAATLTPIGTCVDNSMTFGHGSNAGHSSGVAGVDARRATPPDPRLARWGLAGGRQLDPSHPALVTREDSGVEPCLIPCGPSLSLSRLPA